MEKSQPKMLTVMEFVREFLQKNASKIPNLSFIHIMSLKLIKITQKCLLFWND